MYDLIVIGGGPAGTSAAITAARAGAGVLLLERGRFPRHKVCGEFVSAESLDLLAKLLDSARVNLLRDAVRIPRARLYVDGRTLHTAIDPPAASIARINLDDALWRSAEAAGVATRPQIMVQSVAGEGPFRCPTTAGEFEARSVINASGRWSNLNSSAGKGSDSEKWVGLKAHFAEPSPEASVDLYFFKGGYCGVQPVAVASQHSGGRVNACAMARADVAASLPEVFARNSSLLKRSREWHPLSEPVSTSPLVFREPQPERDGVLMAGDAAGFVDPFVGDGISLALRSGSLAAERLVAFFRGETSLPEAISRYRDAYQRSLLPVFRASSKIRRMLCLPRAMRSSVLFFLEKTPAVSEYLVRKTR